MDVEELAAHMRQAGDLADRPGSRQRAEPGIAVGVHPPGEAFKMALRMHRLAVGREAVPGRRRRGAVPGPFVPDVGPDPAGRRPAGARRQQLDRGVVGEQGPAGQHIAPDGIGQRLQQRRRLADPAGERRAVEIDAIAGEDPGLAIQRQVIAVLRDQHMRERAGAGSATLDRPWRQRRLVERLASAAGQARAHDALHHEAAGDIRQARSGFRRASRVRYSRDRHIFEVPV